MTKTQKLKIQNRITLLSTNGKDNHNIVKKLKRQLKNAEKQED
jgi:hypothetical protein